MAEPLTAFFLPVEPGRRFCIFHEPAGGAPRGGLVYVHPFAEEMNKARRMAARQSRRLAAAGYAIVQVDLHGCGDSTGEFAEATWSAWHNDVRAAVQWLAPRAGGPVSLWGLRLGGTLAAEIAAAGDLKVDRLLLWQPVVSGEQFLTQFLRLQLASEMLAGGAAQSGLRELRAALAGGASLEIAGYDLQPAMAAAIEGLKLAELKPQVKSVHWLEVSGHEQPALGPASRRVADAWRASGLDVREGAVAGEPFWTTLEITDCDALLAATEASLAGAA